MCASLFPVAAQVHLDELRSLQSEVHHLFVKTFPEYTFISSRPGESHPDERIEFQGTGIGGITLNTDSGGNTYAQCAKYFVSSALDQRKAAKPAPSAAASPCCGAKSAARA